MTIEAKVAENVPSPSAEEGLVQAVHQLNDVAETARNEAALPNNIPAVVANGFIQKMKDTYFKNNSLESTELYEALGIKFYKKWLPASGDAAVSRRAKRGDVTSVFPNTGSQLERLKTFEAKTRKLETIHLGWGALYGAVSAETYELTHSLGVVAAQTAFNVAANLYPIMLQRYNRLRTNRIMQGIVGRY